LLARRSFSQIKAVTPSPAPVRISAQATTGPSPTSRSIAGPLFLFIGPQLPAGPVSHPARRSLLQKVAILRKIQWSVKRIVAIIAIDKSYQ
jgi:hypothetical protein